MRADTLAVVLAGGLARRMGGGDKPLCPLAGRPLLDWVLEALRPQVAAVALNANGDPGRFAAWGLPVLPDPVEGFIGPLAGILAAMDWAAAQGAPFVVTASGDSPFLPADYVARLHAAREVAGAPLSCAASGGRTHPPNALWSVALREDLRAALVGGERKIDRWTARHGIAQAEWPAEPVDPFFNANTPEDLAEAARLLHKLPARKT
ncbi:MAG: molybdenum cofactor guanylyltransferase MobA [Rhodovarius sp.]|nr:molybdenum cofactor guanylyltransferase MobA [Rhodovarius sp.]MDW8315352.1 molybdenum cofactor guanylyltransferase MobA [Rhodovarius sp.]